MISDNRQLARHLLNLHNVWLIGLHWQTFCAFHWFLLRLVCFSLALFR